MHDRVGTQSIKALCSVVKKLWSWTNNLISPPSEYGEFLKDVVAILEMGARGKYPKKEIEDEAEKRNLKVVHVFGERGLFEPISGTDKYRLNNRHGLPLLMNHLTIQEARRHSDRAFFVAIAAIVVAIVGAILC